MEKNKVIIQSGLFLLAFVIIFSVGISFYLKIDNPIFLENYKEISIYKRDDGSFQEKDFTIHYITNSSDPRKVTDIYLKDAPDLDFRVDEYGFGGNFFFPMFDAPQSRRPGKIYGRHSARTIYIKLYPNPGKTYDGMQIENLIINFDNGDIMEVNIGKIILREHGAQNEYVLREGSGSSSDGTASSNLLVQDTIVLEKLDSPFLDYIKDDIEITVDGRDYREISGLSYKAGDRLRIESTFKSSNNLLDKYTSLDMEFHLYFREGDGSVNSVRAHSIHSKSYGGFDFTLWDMISYLQQRGAI